MPDMRDAHQSRSARSYSRGCDMSAMWHPFESRGPRTGFRVSQMPVGTDTVAVGDKRRPSASQAGSNQGCGAGYRSAFGPPGGDALPIVESDSLVSHGIVVRLSGQVRLMPFGEFLDANYGSAKSSVRVVGAGRALMKVGDCRSGSLALLYSFAVLVFSGR
jgi:hypothetical protein